MYLSICIGTLKYCIQSKEVLKVDKFYILYFKQSNLLIHHKMPGYTTTLLSNLYQILLSRNVNCTKKGLLKSTVLLNSGCYFECIKG